MRDAIDFYQHERDWSNWLITVQTQMIDFDLPYGIEYGFNFQPFVNKCDIKDRSNEDLTQKPEMIKRKAGRLFTVEAVLFCYVSVRCFNYEAW